MVLKIVVIPAQDTEAQSKAVIHVPWTFMFEILPNHLGIVERLSRHNNFRFDGVSWPCDGLESPSCIHDTRNRCR